MVGANDALCVDWRAVGRGHLIGVRGTQVQVLKVDAKEVARRCVHWCQQLMFICGRTNMFRRSTGKRKATNAYFAQFECHYGHSP